MTLVVGKLASRLRHSSASWYVLASAGVVAAIVAVTSLLTLWPYDGDKPISHPAEAIERLLLPEGTLERVDSRLASLLGVDKEASAHKTHNLLEVASGASLQLGERLYKIAATTTEPVSGSDNSSRFSALVPVPLPTPSTNVPTPPVPAEEPSQEVTSESPAPTMDEPFPSPPMDTTSPPATEEALSAPPATEAPPTTSEPPSPPSTGASLPQEDTSPSLPVQEPLTGSPPPPTVS